MTSGFLCFPQNLKTFQSFRKTRKVISSTNINEIDLGLAISFPLGPRKKKQKMIDDRELIELVEEAQAKSTKYATKYALNVFQGNFCT